MKNQKSNSWKSILIKTAVVSVIVLVGIEVFATYNNNDTTQPETYADRVLTIEEIENNSPTDFLSADGKYRESFWGTKLKLDVSVTNQATLADYKDVVIRIRFYSKTNTLIGTEDHTIYEILPPNSVKNFKLEVKNFKDVETIGWDVIDALPN